ncbi:MAG TPA: hypothetical protein VKB30_06220 [Candidatus Limnocylindrales bacterium]|nr:hypothetical protein [Candidatus Limnocylindrales bacterium]
MSDDFDPTRRSADASVPGDAPAVSGEELGVTPDELSTPHDQPAEGGREQAEDEPPGPPRAR